MATIQPVIKNQGLNPERGSVCLSTEGSGIVVLNASALSASDATAADILKVMGNVGSLETDILSAGINVKRVQVPHGYRFLDVFQLAIGDDADPTITTGTTIRVFGKVDLVQGIKNNTPSDANTALPAPDNWWIPLVTSTDVNEVTLSTEITSMGEDGDGYVYGLSLPTYYKLAGVTEIVVMVTTVGAVGGSASAKTMQIVGRFTT